MAEIPAKPVTYRWIKPRTTVLRNVPVVVRDRLYGSQPLQASDGRTPTVSFIDKVKIIIRIKHIYKLTYKWQLKTTMSLKQNHRCFTDRSMYMNWSPNEQSYLKLVECPSCSSFLSKYIPAESSSSEAQDGN